VRRIVVKLAVFKRIHYAAPLACVPGAVADKWYVSLPPQVHLSTVTALGEEDGESPCCDVTSNVSDDVTESPPCYCQQEQQHQGTSQYELLAVT